MVLVNMPFEIVAVPFIPIFIGLLKSISTLFFNNSDKSVFDKMMKHLEKMRDTSRIKPFKVFSNAEDIEAGAPAEYEIPITFDQSNFFG